MKFILVLFLLACIVFAGRHKPEQECQDEDPNCSEENCARNPSLYAKCKFTCSKCQEPPCRDSTAVDCEKYDGYCAEASYIDQLQIYCPKFCGFCEGGVICRDRVTGCADMKEDCHEPLIQKYCQRTCKACDKEEFNDPMMQKKYDEKVQQQQYEQQRQRQQQEQEQQQQQNDDDLSDVKLDYEDEPNVQRNRKMEEL